DRDSGSREHLARRAQRAGTNETTSLQAGDGRGERVHGGVGSRNVKSGCSRRRTGLDLLKRVGETLNNGGLRGLLERAHRLLPCSTRLLGRSEFAAVGRRGRERGSARRG